MPAPDSAAAGFELRLAPAEIHELRARGLWPAGDLGALLRERAQHSPRKAAVIDARGRTSYAELDELADRVAAGLAAHGIGAGQVVSCLLPNRREAAALLFGAARAGAALNPIVPILGPRELRIILRQARSAALVFAEGLRGLEPEVLAERVAPELPGLREWFALGDALPESLLRDAPPADGAAATAAAGAAPEVCLLLYTSGTTSEPKGVLHGHGTLLAECRSIAGFYGLGADDVLVMASPVGHISGLFYGILLPVYLGATGVLLESWDPERYLELLAREGGTFSAGATPFLHDLLEARRRSGRDLAGLRVFACGGADVPPELVREALSLGLRCGRGYGSTEFPSISSGTGVSVPDEKRAHTDGAPIPPNQVEIRDEAGRALAPGRDGEIWARGPELCLGYRDPARNADAFDARGFFRTGDLGVLDADGYLTVTGRLKDLIVRGGEKFAAKEIEDLLFEHPGVRQVAIVPLPDPRLGERVCAFVVPADPASPPRLEDLVRFLEAREISRRKLPEHLELADAFPTTAAGKVQKHVLRERLRLRRALS